MEHSETIVSDENTIQQRCIIKEEIVISDIEDLDDSATNNEEFKASQLGGRSFPIFSNPSTGTNANSRTPREQMQSQPKKIKIEQTSCDSEELSFAETKLLTALGVEKQKVANKTTVANNVDAAVDKFCETHCPNCNTSKPVVRQKARCLECKIQLLYQCIPCNGKTYKTYTDLRQHLKIKHVSTISSISESKTSNPIFLRKSEINHHECDKCGRTYGTSKHMLDHRRVCGKEPNFKCNQCNYAARYKGNLASHKREKHSNESGFNCRECGKIYTNERSLKRHLKVYCGKNKMLVCEHCQKRWYRKDEMIRHLIICHSCVYGNKKKRSTLT